MRKRLFLFLFAAAATLKPLFAGADPENAAPARPTVQWRCWYDQDVHIVCLMESLARPAELAASAAGYAPAGTLPPVVRALREAPEAFRRRTVRIPLHGHPFDWAFTEQLARAGVCGARPACSVRFSAAVPPAGELARIRHWQDDDTWGSEQLAERTGAGRGGPQ